MVAPPLLHRAPPEAGVRSSCSWCLYLCLPPGHLCGYLLHVWVSPPAFGTRELDPTQACQEGSPARSQPSFWVKRWVGGAWANDLVLGICWAPSKRGTADGLLGVSGPQTNRAVIPRASQGWCGSCSITSTIVTVWIPAGWGLRLQGPRSGSAAEGSPGSLLGPIKALRFAFLTSCPLAPPFPRDPGAAQDQKWISQAPWSGRKETLICR